jgi:hypothetical protein
MLHSGQPDDGAYPNAAGLSTLDSTPSNPDIVIKIS